MTCSRFKEQRPNIALPCEYCCFLLIHCYHFLLSSQKHSRLRRTIGCAYCDGHNLHLFLPFACNSSQIYFLYPPSIRPGVLRLEPVVRTRTIHIHRIRFQHLYLFVASSAAERHRYPNAITCLLVNADSMHGEHAFPFILFSMRFCFAFSPLSLNFHFGEQTPARDFSRPGDQPLRLRYCH